MLRKKNILISIIWLGLISGVFCLPVAAESDLLHSTLKEGVGVRAMSMGSAMTSYAEGSVGLFYNPAGLAKRGTEYLYDNMDYRQGRFKEFRSHLAYKSPIGIGYWRKQDGTGSVEVTAIGYGKQNRNGVSWGLTYKGIREKTTQNTANGWSTDFGAILHLSRQINVGFLAQDVLSDNVATNPSLRTGFSFFGPRRLFVISSDFVYRKQQGKTEKKFVNYGIEYALTEGVFLRAGWQERRYSSGFSVQLPIASIDYGIIFASSSTEQTIYMVGFKVGQGPAGDKFRRR